MPSKQKLTMPYSSTVGTKSNKKREENIREILKKEFLSVLVATGLRLEKAEFNAVGLAQNCLKKIRHYLV